MTKRKATESLDEWLIEQRLASEVQLPVAEAPLEPSIVTPPPTAETSQPQVATESVTWIPAEVDITEEVASEWLWSLLEKSGYERW